MIKTWSLQKVNMSCKTCKYLSKYLLSCVTNTMLNKNHFSQFKSNHSQQFQCKIWQTWPISGRCNTVIQLTTTGEECHASPWLFFCGPEKHYWYIYLCQWYTWDEQTGASVSIDTYCPQYGVPDRPSYIHTSRQREEREFVIQAILYIHPSISAILRGGHTYRGNREWHMKLAADFELH